MLTTRVGRLGLLLAIAWATGCASAQILPLGTDQASRDFLIGQWEGTYEWPSDPVKQPKKATLLIDRVSLEGEVQAVLRLFDASGARSTARRVKGAIKAERVVFDYSPKTDYFRDLVLWRAANDRLDGSCDIMTTGGMGATRMDTIELRFRR